MRQNADQHGQHLENAAFIRLRDGECDSSEERELRKHLAGCSLCRENAKTFDRLADGFLAAVGEIKHPTELRLPGRVTAGRNDRGLSRRVPRVWHTRRSVRVAALVAVVVALASATAPVRAVVSSGWQAIAELLSLQPAPRASRETAQETLSDSVQPELSEGVNETALPLMTRAASFTPRDEVFLIVFAHPQAGGTLSVAVDTASRASVRVFGNADPDELVVFRAGVRILNQAVSSASYEFTLPGGLRNIEVQIAGRTVVTLSPADLVGRAEWQMDLAGAGER